MYLQSAERRPHWAFHASVKVTTSVTSIVGNRSRGSSLTFPVPRILLRHKYD
jgi:hypothetical protein